MVSSACGVVVLLAVDMGYGRHVIERSVPIGRHASGLARGR